MKISKERKPYRVDHYISHENEIKMDNISYPVAYQKIPIIEKMNNIRINVSGYEEDEITILYISEREDEDVINLLLLANEHHQQHYCLIRHFSRFMAHRTKHRQAAFYCYRCLHGFSREDLLMKHIEFCKKHASQSIIMPDESNNLLQFTSIQMQHPIAFTIFADFESLIVPLSTTSPSSSTSYIQNIARHEPCGYAYVVIGPDGKSTKPTQVYRGQNAVKHFLNAIIEEKDIIEKKLKDVKPLRLTPDEEASFQSAIICSICKKSLDEKRARDHDHISGKFRGSAHISCNLKYKQSKKIPVIFHNMKNYNGHHIMTELG